MVTEPIKAQNKMIKQNKSTEYQKMRDGQLYSFDESLIQLVRENQERLRIFNCLPPDSPEQKRHEVLYGILGSVGLKPHVEPPFYADYGKHISVGDYFYANTDCVILDGANVQIGCHVFLGPGVHIYTASHPLDPEIRRAGLEFVRPVKIGDGVWIGGRAVICPGVTVGADSVVGAGSVVTKDVEPFTVVAGNPARIIRRLNESHKAAHPTTVTVVNDHDLFKSNGDPKIQQHSCFCTGCLTSSSQPLQEKEEEKPPRQLLHVVPKIQGISSAVAISIVGIIGGCWLANNIVNATLAFCATRSSRK